MKKKKLFILGLSIALASASADGRTLAQEKTGETQEAEPSTRRSSEEEEKSGVLVKTKQGTPDTGVLLGDEEKLPEAGEESAAEGAFAEAGEDSAAEGAFTEAGEESAAEGASADVGEDASETAMEEYIFSDSSYAYLEESELAGLPLQLLAYARYEIYARKGLLFDSPELAGYFAEESWYFGFITEESFTDTMLNDYETANIAALRKAETALTTEGYQPDQENYSYEPVYAYRRGEDAEEPTGEEEDGAILESENETESDAELETEAATDAEVETGSETEAGLETEGETDTELETEADIDVEIETGSGTEAEVETEAETNVEVETEVETDTELETEAETNAEVETEGDTDAELETEVGTKAELETEVETDAELETGLGTEAELEAEAETNAEVETEARTEAGLETEVETDAESETEAESDAGVETELETEAETNAEVETGAELEAEAETETRTEAQTVERSYTAGTYTSVIFGKQSDVSVTCTFSESKLIMAAVDVSGETDGVGAEISAEMVKRLLIAQSSEIDGVSGATITSDAVIAAAADCFAQALSQDGFSMRETETVEEETAPALETVDTERTEAEPLRETETEPAEEYEPLSETETEQMTAAEEASSLTDLHNVDIMGSAANEVQAEAPAQTEAVDPAREYIFYDAGSRYLETYEVEALSLQAICYAKNEIYARHGRKFNSRELQEYFNSKSWYTGIIEPDEFTDAVFNEYERQNIQLLVSCEFARAADGYALDQPGYDITAVGTLSLRNNSAGSETNQGAGTSSEGGESSNDGVSIGLYVSEISGEMPQGALVTAVGENSASEAAGLCAGDIIFSFGGLSVTNVSDLATIASSCKTGQMVEVAVWRLTGGTYAKEVMLMTF